MCMDLHAHSGLPVINLPSSTFRIQRTFQHKAATCTIRIDYSVEDNMEAKWKWNSLSVQKFHCNRGINNFAHTDLSKALLVSNICIITVSAIPNNPIHFKTLTVIWMINSYECVMETALKCICACIQRMLLHLIHRVGHSVVLTLYVLFN